MHPTMDSVKFRTRSLLMGTTLLAGIAAVGAPTAAFAQASDQAMETVVVTGYRASLTDSTNAKRASVSFSDTVFAEDIGKFPDTNIAEALNRIPGVTISREIDGEGINVSIRGLGTNFTKILLNGAQVAVASTGATDQRNNNREVDLNMFPTELFTQLTVSKSPTANMVEGGAAGSVTMRSQRPFDKPGLHIAYNLQGTDQSISDSMGMRGALIFSDTEGPFGLLVGIAGVQSNVMVKGWEDGNAGWNTPTFQTGQCAGTCTQFGGNSWNLPATIPVGVNVPIPGGGGTFYPAGTVINAALLSTLNPGVTNTQLSNALLPRLGRSMFSEGSRDRYNAVVSAEFRPTDDLHFYVDFIFGRQFNDLNRSDIDWGVRGGVGSQAMIPVGLTISPGWLADGNTAGLGGATRSATFYDAGFSLEARPFKEKGDFFSINPGMDWQVTDLLSVDFQLNASRSHFLRDSPTVLVSTCLNTVSATLPGCTPPTGGNVVTFSNPAGAPFPTISSVLDLNNPANFQWNNGRVNLQDEKRYSYTNGAHLDLKYGGDEMSVKVGAAYDEIFRNIVAIDDTGRWANAICGDNPNVYLPGPNSGLAGCTGQNTTSTPAGFTVPTAYIPGPTSGYGTGYSTGFPALAWGGSLVPQTALASYLKPGPTGFITVDYNKIFAASNYYAIDRAAIAAVCAMPSCTSVSPPFSTSSNTGGTSGAFDEKNVGLYAQLDGVLDWGHKLKYDIGLRWTQTRQSIVSPVVHTDPRNATLLNGGLYPNFYSFSAAKSTYQAFLPSIALVYEVADDFQVRGSISRTMTRPDPSQMISVVNFSDPNATSATLGNPALKPFYSNNIDLGAEYYTGAEGYFGVAVFRKSISGFTNQITTSQTFSYLSQFGVNYGSLSTSQQIAISTHVAGGCTSDATCANAPISVNEQFNLPGLKIINGMEFDIVQPLDFLLEPYGLKGFGFTGNVTILDQKATGIVSSIATGVAPLQYNLTGYYEDNGLMVRMSYNWNDRVYGTLGNQQNVCFPAAASGVKPTGCPGGAFIFGAPYGQADISSSLKLSRLFGDLPSDPEVTFNVQNVFSAKQVTYFQLPDAVHSYYIKGQTYMFGLRGSF